METIKAYKTRNGGYGFSDNSNEHNFVIFDEGQHAIDEDGLIWQVVDGINEDENVAYITFEDGEHIFNYAEDGGAISWMKGHYCALSLVDWNKVEEELDDEDVFDLMQDSKNEDSFCQSLIKKYKENTWEDKSYYEKVNDVKAMNDTF